MRSDCVLHIWDDSFFVLFYFRAAFTMGEEVGVTDDDDDDDDDARLEITHISHITNMKILNRMRERC